MISRTDTSLPTDYVIEGADPLSAILDNPSLSAECKAGAVVLAAGGAPTALAIPGAPRGQCSAGGRVTRRWDIRTVPAPHGSVAAIIGHHA
jgi:hypothetical protein